MIPVAWLIREITSVHHLDGAIDLFYMFISLRMIGRHEKIFYGEYLEDALENVNGKVNPDFSGSEPFHWHRTGELSKSIHLYKQVLVLTLNSYQLALHVDSTGLLLHCRRKQSKFHHILLQFIAVYLARRGATSGRVTTLS